MFSKSLAIVALVAFAEARFGQEQCSPALGDIQAVTSGGQPGQAATIAGGAISNLLAAANPCDQLKTADNIVATLGNGADSIKAAKEFLNCEKNFNQFVQSTPTLCSDASLPSTAELRGVLPKIDPAVTGSDLANQLAAQSLTTPFNADGLSIADIFAAQGFSNFTTKDAAGNAGAAAASSASNAGASTGAAAASTNATAAASSDAGATADASNDDACDAEPVASAGTGSDAAAASNSTASTGSAGAASNATASTGSGASTATGGSDVTNTVSTVAGADFGLCNPGMKFESGINGRKATEFTFQAADAKISAIQQEALNFNIITNRICDELTNQCQANQAAKDLCKSTQASISSLGKVRTTADAWNTALGFAGQDTNPDKTSTVGEPTA